MQVWCAACGSLQIQDAKMTQKIAIWAPSHNFVKLCFRNEDMYRQSAKKLAKQQYLLQMSPRYGELRPTNGWNRLAGLGHPTKFQRAFLLQRRRSPEANQTLHDVWPSPGLLGLHYIPGIHFSGLSQTAPPIFGWAAITLGIDRPTF